MKRFVPAFLVLALALPALAIEKGPRPGDRIAVLKTPAGAGASRVAARLRASLPEYLTRALKGAGYDAHLSPFTLVELEERSDGGPSRDDYVVEIMYADVDGENWGGVGIGRTGVGAEVSVIEARAESEIRLYDATTLELADSFVLTASAVAPAITGVGVGGRDGFLYLAIPILTRHPYHIAVRRLASDAAARMGRGPAGGEE